MKPCQRRDENGASLFGGVPQIAWTAERVADLKRWWLRGDTSYQIAERTGRTRNSVISKLGRIGLLRAVRPGSRKTAAQPAKAVAAEGRRLHRREEVVVATPSLPKLRFLEGARP